MSRNVKKDIMSEFNSLNVTDKKLNLEYIKANAESGTEKKEQVVFTIEGGNTISRRSIIMKNVFAAVIAVFVLIGVVFGAGKLLASKPDISSPLNGNVINNTESPSLTNSPVPSVTPDPAKGIVLYADLTHDNLDEKIVVDINKTDDSTVKVYSGDKLIWTGNAGLVHAGWNAIYLYSKNGLDYLMTWSPFSSTGGAYFTYDVFYFSSEGKKMPLASRSIEFLSDICESDTKNVSQIKNYYEEAKQYLADSITILDTTTGELEYSTGDNLIKNKYDDNWFKSIIKIKSDTQVKKMIPSPVVDTVTRSINIGMPKEDVVSLLGKNYTDIASMHLNRYDFDKAAGYNPDLFIDMIDYDGLLSGKVSTVLFIEYDQSDKVRRFTMYYNDQGKIAEYRLREDKTSTYEEHDIL